MNRQATDFVDSAIARHPNQSLSQLNARERNVSTKLTISDTVAAIANVRFHEPALGAIVEKAAPHTRRISVNPKAIR